MVLVALTISRRSKLQASMASPYGFITGMPEGLGKGKREGALGGGHEDQPKAKKADYKSGLDAPVNSPKALRVRVSSRGS